DIAVRGDIMYVDSYTDLLAFNISDPSNPTYVSRVEDVFNFSSYGDYPSFNREYPMALVQQDQGIVVGWEVAETTDEVQDYWGGGWAVNETMLSSADGATAGIPVSSGTGGSTAQFTIVNDHLYTLEPNEIGVFDIAGEPVHVSDVTVNRVGETLFPSQGHLFIGTTTGMLIYDLSNPALPSLRSEYDHFTACDPVVVQGDRAYVTLATGRNCFGTIDVLQVINIADMDNPVLIAEYQMENPRGLGLDNDALFLCDGPAGLKVFDKANDHTVDQNMLAQFPGIVTNDVIPNNGVLLMTSESGIYQYDYTNIQNITQLSHIPVR
ncbi:MAG: hypothetical protein AAF570_21195, partial [Bacteroidota bacterium]